MRRCTFYYETLPLPYNPHPTSDNRPHSLLIMVIWTASDSLSAYQESIEYMGPTLLKKSNNCGEYNTRTHDAGIGTMRKMHVETNNRGMAMWPGVHTSL